MIPVLFGIRQNMIYIYQFICILLKIQMLDLKMVFRIGGVQATLNNLFVNFRI